MPSSRSASPKSLLKATARQALGDLASLTASYAAHATADEGSVEANPPKRRLALDQVLTHLASGGRPDSLVWVDDWPNRNAPDSPQAADVIRDLMLQKLTLVDWLRLRQPEPALLMPQVVELDRVFERLEIACLDAFVAADRGKVGQPGAQTPVEVCASPAPGEPAQRAIASDTLLAAVGQILATDRTGGLDAAIALVRTTWCARHVAVWLWQEAQGFTVVPAALGEVWDLAFLGAGRGLCTDADPILAAFENQTTIVLSDAQHDATFARVHEYAATLDVRAAAFVPLVHQGRTVGVLSLHDQDARTFTPDELTALEAIGRSFAVAIAASFLEQERNAHRDVAASLQAKLEQVEQTNRLHDEFLANLSYEFRTPINTITGFGSVLEDGLAGPLTPQQHAYMKNILAGSDVLLALINNLLELTRIRAGRFTLQLHPVDFHQVTKAVISGLAPLAHKKQQRLIDDLPRTLPPVYADDERLTQALVNLVTNALKFTPPGGDVKLWACVAGTLLSCEVRTTAPGIPDEDFPASLERYFHGAPEARGPVGGTGLGLAIAKSIVESHGGTIGVGTIPGQGSTFRFTLPLATDARPCSVGIK